MYWSNKAAEQRGNRHVGGNPQQGHSHPDRQRLLPPPGRRELVAATRALDRVLL
uniref:Uncharacterized protein n=1 Tax=Magnetospirillum gryphiswaldense TaxID=55518 RepID=A4TZS1_9PROT|nr:hypothetical protein MGR_3280 [Magnetospirillum gryphiswaldense MSR-1]